MTLKKLHYFRLTKALTMNENQVLTYIQLDITKKIQNFDSQLKDFY